MTATLSSSLSAFDTPLERLSNRSALKRWQEVRDKWIPQRKSRKERREERKAAPSLPPTEPVQTPSELTPSPEHYHPTPQVTSPVPVNQDRQRTVQEILRPAPLSPVPQPISIPGVSRSAEILDLQEPVVDVMVPDPYQMQEVIADEGSVQKKQPEILLDLPTPEDAVKVAQVGDPKNVIQNAPVLRSISEIEPFHDYSAVDEVPQDEVLSDFQVAALPASGSLDRNFGQTHYHWMASNLAHDPLYFEDVSLERYGHTYPFVVQPFVSMTKFGVQMVGLPYQMALNPVDCDQYALGYYRPGDCAPKLCYRVPWNKKAAATAAGVYTGLIFLFP